MDAFFLKINAKRSFCIFFLERLLSRSIQSVFSHRRDASSMRRSLAYLTGRALLFFKIDYHLQPEQTDWFSVRLHPEMSRFFIYFCFDFLANSLFPAAARIGSQRHVVRFLCKWGCSHVYTATGLPRTQPCLD